MFYTKTLQSNAPMLSKRIPNLKKSHSVKWSLNIANIHNALLKTKMKGNCMSRMCRQRD